ncbi:TPA: O174 family O-antigen polymerase, partial [Escherichia coli]|nr:O174 family O-antigen polymerase [Escherichia coli]
NFIPFLLCCLMTIIFLTEKKIKLNYYKLFSILYVGFFFILQYAYFIQSTDSIETLLRLISVNFSFLFGLLLGWCFKREPIEKLFILWVLLLSIANICGVINYSDGVEFNHLNFTLPLGTVVTWLIFKAFMKDTDRYIFTLSVILFLFFNIIFAGSRTAIFLPILVSLFIMVIFRKYVSIKKTVISFIILITITIISLPYILSNLNAYFLSKVQNMADISEDSRYNLYLKCFNMLLEHPFGIGYGNYKYFITEPYPHNILLEIGLNSGVLGCFVFITYVMITTMVIIKKTKSCYNEKNLFVLTIFLYSLFSWMFSNDFASSSVVFFLLGVLGHIASSNNEKEIK